MIRKRDRLNDATAIGGGDTLFLPLSDLFIGILFIFIILFGTMAISYWYDFNLYAEKLDALEAERKQAAQLRAALNLQASDLERENARLNLRLQKLLERVASQRELIDQLYGRLDATQSESREVQADRQRLLDELADLTGRVIELRYMLDQDASERERIAREAAETERELNATKRELTRLDKALRQNFSSTRRLLLQVVARLRQELDVSDDDLVVSGTVLRMKERLLFDSGEPEMKPAGRVVLGSVARILVELLPCYTDRRLAPSSNDCNPATANALEAIYVEGHTDDQPVRRGSSRYRDNWELSALRSATTYRSLLQAEPNLNRLVNSRGQPLFGLSAYADSRPAASGQGRAIRAQNRRIDFRFLVATPGLEPSGQR